MSKTTTEAGIAQNPMLPAVYLLVIWLGCCFILGLNFYLDIRHHQKIEKIFEKYDKDMSVLNGR